jgi:hypothetical protein
LAWCLLMATDPTTGNRYVPVNRNEPPGIKRATLMILGITCGTLLLITFALAITFFIANSLYDIKETECITTCTDNYNYTCTKKVCDGKGCAYILYPCVAYSMSLTLESKNTNYTKVLFRDITDQVLIKCNDMVRCYYAVDNVFKSASIKSSLSIYNIKRPSYTLIGILIIVIGPPVIICTFICILGSIV